MSASSVPSTGRRARAGPNLARWLGEAGRVGEAVAQFHALLADMQRVLDPDNLARRLVNEGRRPPG